jgi:hypothetical protein
LNNLQKFNQGKSMIHSIVNSIGLLLGIIGTGILWQFGLPASIDREGWQTMVIDQKDEKMIAKGKLYDFRANCGFALLLTGFVLQLISNFLPC